MLGEGQPLFVVRCSTSKKRPVVACRNTWALPLAVGATVQLCICRANTYGQTLSYASHASQVPTGALEQQSPQLHDPHTATFPCRQMPRLGQLQEVVMAELRSLFAAEGFHAASKHRQLVQVHASERFRTGDRFTCQPRQIAQYSFFGAISVYTVPKYADPLKVGNDCPFSTTARSCTEFLHTVCVPHGLPPREVCWFLNFPHSLPSYGSTSHTEVCRSPECMLSCCLNWWLMPMENMLLNQQHEMLRAAIDPTWRAPEHSYQSPSNWRRAPHLPKDDLLAKFFLRCGVSKRHPLEAVVTEVCTACCRNADIHSPQGLFLNNLSSLFLVIGQRCMFGRTAEGMASYITSNFET